MNDSKISVRYAKALFESALSKDVLDVVRSNMEEVQAVCKVKEFDYLLHSPVIGESQKIEAVKEILDKRVHPLTMSLLNLVFENGRENYIPAIARNYVDLYKKHKGIKSATITSATALPKEVSTKIVDVIQKALGLSVELETKENADLIGGFVIRIDDQQYDASVANSLKNVKKQLLN